ncbi:chlorohydrolase family protein [Microbacterium capsulatum]|uniref:Chlorohydrolase family protein n=1 Tax=Microbacterium capsulatum TaxID=3041921 RepID=A0ABU0XG73_9MICO|nr:chlorohydrolase family protein [Microbacterium sp. ASV81]MDQ4213588.1 chlorohydrolase family protein [Microbacterium sp. ASV81]
MRKLITASWIVAHENDRHVELPDGAILVEDDLIVEVGPQSRFADVVVDERIDLGHAVVTPGLIDLDALTDIDHLILDSWSSGEDSKSLTWSAEYFPRSRHVFSPEQLVQVREYALVQLALHGITSYMPIASEVHSSWAEDFDTFAAMAAFSSKIGLRGFIGPSFRSAAPYINDEGQRRVRYIWERGPEGLAEAVRFLDHIDSLEDPLLTGVLLPCRIETIDPELLKEVARISEERNVLVRLHALQGVYEREWIIEHWEVTPLELLEKVGLLGERLIIPHGVVIDVHPEVFGEDRGDLAKIASSGASIIHCALTNARYGHNLHLLENYIAQGVNICIGTDSFPPDIIRGIDVGVQIAKAQSEDLGRNMLAEYFEAATLGGAKALHRPDLGRIEAGAQADISAFSLADFRSGPTDDPLRTLVLNGTARDAVLTMVAGRTVMRDGRIDGIDLDEMRRTGQALFEQMRAAYAERDFRKQSEAELFPPVFPISAHA